MKSYKQYLCEVHYKDILGDKFENFRKKYKKVAKDNSYYVQFTDYNKDVLEKNPYELPNHSDPVGVYGYPLKYVINNPADIWYGATSKYLRVLKDTTKNKLILNDIDQYDVNNYLREIGYSYSDSQIKALKKLGARILPSSRKNYWGNILFTYIQIDVDKSLDSGELVIRDGKEQTNLIKKLGFDSIEDKSTNDTQAIINSREPEQIIFLNRYAFDVIEIFNLNQKTKISNVVNPVEYERKLVAKIASIIDDKIVEGPERENKMFWSYYWTKKGRKITIIFDNTRDSSKLTLGQKKHKAETIYYKKKIRIKIFTEFGNLDVYGSEIETFDEILDKVETKWNQIKNNKVVDNWQPLSKKVEDELEKAERDLQYEKQWRNEYKELIREWKDKHIPNLLLLAKHYNISLNRSDLDVYPDEYNKADKLSLQWLDDILVRGYLRKQKEDDDVQGFVKDKELGIFNKIKPILTKVIEDGDQYSVMPDKGLFTLTFFIKDKDIK